MRKLGEFVYLGKNYFLHSANERSKKIKKNILASFVIKSMSIIVSLLVVPITINYVNPTRYGIWITLSSIIGWFSFFDIGLGNGLRNKLAESLANGDIKLAKSYVSTTYAILIAIMLSISLIILIINPLINWSLILNTAPEESNELSSLALIIISFFCAQFILQLITTVLTADQKPAKASLINLAGSILALFIIFMLTKITNGSLLYLALAIGSSQVFVLILSSLWLYSNNYKKIAPSYKYINIKYARNLINLGVKFFIIQVAVLILYQSSNIIIAQLFGPAEVTLYNIAYKYFSIIPMVFAIIISPFWSAFTDAYTLKDTEWIKNMIVKLRKIWVMLIILSIIMLVASNIVYKLWIGKMIEIPISLSIVMAIYVIVTSWCGIYSNFLNGVGKIKLQLYFSLIGSIINIPLAVFLGKEIGVSGVILSTVLLSAISAIWAPIQYNKLIYNKAKGIWNK